MLAFVSRNISSGASALQTLSVHAFSRHASQLKLQETGGSFQIFGLATRLAVVLLGLN